MRKLMLPLMIGLMASGGALAQTTPVAGQGTGAATAVAARPADALSEAQIKTSIANAGYKEVENLKFDDGVWRTKARGGDDHWEELTVGAVTGRVYPADAPSKLSKDEVNAKLAAAGYQNIDDVDYEDGLWNAEATDAQGVKVDLRVDPVDGSVVSSEKD